MSTCPNCNKELSEGTVFCDGCGTQVPQTVFCPACGKQTPANFAYCQECGAPIAQPKKAPAKKGLPKNALMLGGIAVAVVAVLVVVCCLIFGGGSSDPVFGLYLRDGELAYNALKGGKGFDVTGDYNGAAEGISTVMLTDDGKYLFYPDKDSGSIYYRDVTNSKGEATKVDSDISEYEINSDGSLITYLKDGKLYQRKRGSDDKNKIAEEVSRFYSSNDGKRIIFKTADNWYLKVEGKDKEKICDATSTELQFNKAFTVFHFVDEEHNLYKKEAGKDKVKLVTDVVDVLYLYESGECYYLAQKSEEDPTTLYYHDGKEAKKLADNYYDWRTRSSETPILIYETRDAEAESGELFIDVKGNSTELKQEKKAQGFDIDDSNSVVIYLDDIDDETGMGDLYRFEISGNKPGEVKKYDEDVYTASFLPETKDIAVLKDYKNNKGDLYVNKKKVDTDVSSIKPVGKKMAYMMDWNSEKSEGTLKFWDGGSSKKIADDVSNKFVLLADGRVLFIYEGDLYQWDGGKPKKIDEDVTAIYDPRQFAREYHMSWIKD